ncbi:hypothetical protein FQA39_LY10821 [Lamprigera yunnana]|nr:hypothetical protein FQA39_LY10821 [Lamprigera yunnana]
MWTIRVTLDLSFDTIHACDAIFNLGLLFFCYSSITYQTVETHECLCVVPKILVNFGFHVKIAFGELQSAYKELIRSNSMCEAKYSLTKPRDTLLNDLVVEFADVLTAEMDTAFYFEYGSKVNDSKPIFKNPFYLNPIEQMELNDHILTLLEKGR